ncbi:hypothetical protein SUGI_0309290 [Cryptomeria japonica]|uniref:uncharacterized protein LOC131075890 n=1 Tax=Cryptomeria japonica TaxID=3369 RepID=UPI002408B265|nr:uncharacterized protein LOC131075890 [Cryptomeria japonica]GLJ17722.1 hypothetical protein SUGI_0309290 [Cryptomeria japonica]
MATFLHHIARETADVQRLAKFYEEVLGFHRIDTPDFGREVVWLSLQSVVALHIIRRDQNANLPETPFNTQADTKKLDPQQITSGHHLSFAVSDYDAFVKKLNERGISTFEQIRQGGEIKQVFFFDVDGNGLEVGNWPPPV